MGQAHSRPQYPALFDVQKVTNKDVLNVRKAPDGTSEIIGTLAYDTKSVEVMTLSEDANGGWSIATGIPADGFCCGDRKSVV